MKTFALAGAAGYVAPRHMAAIKHIGGDLVALYDPHDSVGVVDRYFPQARLFTKLYEFQQFLSSNRVDCVSICSPNDSHFYHAFDAMSFGADVVVEKPVCLTEHHLDNLARLEKAFKQRIYPVLQMRLHDSALSAKQFVMNRKERCICEVVYVAPRGSWYSNSWKADTEKSGGLATNIGVHLFDMCGVLFGRLQAYTGIIFPNIHTVVGTLHFEDGTVKFYLSTHGARAQRKFTIDGVDFDFSTGFENLHNATYEKIVAGCGFNLEDARQSVKICEIIRNHQ